MSKYLLKKPILVDGVTVKELNMDLDELTADDIDMCERQARSMVTEGGALLFPEYSKLYLSCVAAKAAGVTVHDIRSMKAHDYTQVCTRVQNFLLIGESEEEETDSSKLTPGLTSPTEKDTKADSNTLTPSEKK